MDRNSTRAQGGHAPAENEEARNVMGQDWKRQEMCTGNAHIPWPTLSKKEMLRYSVKTIQHFSNSS